MPDLIPLTEAARRLKLPYGTVHRLMLVSKLAGHRRGSRWFVEADSLQRFARERRREMSQVAQESVA